MITDMPSSFRVIAETMLVANPGAEWERLYARINQAPNEAQWLGWLRNATKLAAPVAPPKEWEAPSDWDDARRDDPQRELAARESANILAMLEKMG